MQFVLQQLLRFLSYSEHIFLCSCLFHASLRHYTDTPVFSEFSVIDQQNKVYAVCSEAEPPHKLELN